MVWHRFCICSTSTWPVLLINLHVDSASIPLLRGGNGEDLGAPVCADELSTMPCFDILAPELQGTTLHTLVSWLDALPVCMTPLYNEACREAGLPCTDAYFV